MSIFDYFFLIFCTFFALYCWNESEKHEVWSGRWWFELFCSALNGVVAINIAIKLFS
jgi:hypothetical protein